MEKHKTYNTTKRDTVLMVKGVSRKKRNQFKKHYRNLLKEKGMNLSEFYVKVLEAAFDNPEHILHSERKGLKALLSSK